MPGSTIGKLNINQPLIYCLRPKTYDGTYKVRCGQYYEAIGKHSYELFQDRTPRPSVNFNKLSSNENKKYVEKEKNEWVSHYSKCAIRRINNRKNNSWQDTMITQIKNIIILDFLKTTSIIEFEKLKKKC